MFRRREPDAAWPSRLPGYPVTPMLLFVGAAAALVINTVVTQSLRAPTYLGVVALGAPAFYVWRAQRAPGTGRGPRPHSASGGDGPFQH